MYKFLILSKAEEHLSDFRKNDKSSYIKCFDLLRASVHDPRKGIGQPERLKYYAEKEIYSRRVNKKDRMVYEIFEEEQLLEIMSFKGHYDG